MESLANYESDDGEIKINNKHRSRDSDDKGAKSSHKKYRSRSHSSSQSESEDDHRRKRLNEEKSKSSRRDKRSDNKRNDLNRRRSSSKDNDRRHRKSSSRDDERRDRKRKFDDRDEKRKRRHSSRDRRSRSRSRDRNRHRDSSNERRRDKHDRRDERRSDDRRPKDKDSRDSKDHRDRYERNERHKDEQNRRRNESPCNSKDSDNNYSSSESRVSNSTQAMRRAEAINRTIERRANEKVQQLQKLGIEIPAIIQHHQQQQQKLLLQNQPQLPMAQIKPLMSVNPSIPTNIMTQQSAIETNTSNNETSTDDCNNLALNLANFTSPVLVNARYTEQMQKKKLIWGAKKAATTNGETITTNNKWEAAKFSQDTDGKMASKFLRLMGMKNVPVTSAGDSGDSSSETDPSVKKREQMFNSMEQQYEIARQATHTMRGMGLGFGSQSRPC